jgi:hypothetical protein
MHRVRSVRDHIYTIENLVRYSANPILPSRDRDATEQPNQVLEMLA